MSVDQDSRFANKEAKLLKQMKFPAEYSIKVNLTKVNWDVMRPWIAQRVTELLGVEDDVLIGYIFGLSRAKYGSLLQGMGVAG